MDQGRESVKILLFSTFREKYGVKELVVECNGTIKEELIFTINGRDIRDCNSHISPSSGG